MPTDWKSGETLWLIDFIAPFGGEENMMKELRDSVHKDKKLKMLRPGPDGRLGVMEW